MKTNHQRTWPYFAILLAAGNSVSHGIEPIYPAQEWTAASPADVRMDVNELERAREYALTGSGSGYITRYGRLVMQWGDTSKKYDLKSTTKSIGVTALGLAIADKKIRLTDKAKQHQPSIGVPPDGNTASGWTDEITVLHLATQTAGFDKPGGYEKLLFRPGTKWHYSDGGPNWLAECVTLAYGRDVEELMFERVLAPIGIAKRDLHWRKNAYRPHEIAGVMRREFGSGVHANVDAMARLGYLYLRRGRWQDRQLIPEDFVDRAATAVAGVTGLPEHVTNHGNASDHYGLLWWNNADGTIDNVPRDAFWSWGLYDSLIVVIPSLDIVAARNGKSWQRESEAAHYDVLRRFLQPIARSVQADEPAESNERDTGATSMAPYPRSPVIRSIQWAPATTIVRKASGSDNWPLTWGDDDALYTAYGDGWGFQPRVDEKLSMGFAKVTGGPADFHGINIRSSTGETRGQGADGKKASGMLMVGGTLYLWARNAGNSQLAWSTDKARTWTWSDWRWKTSFGCPTFVNFGRDYAGARDRYVYTISPDSDSAYEPADRLVLARVRRDRIRHRDYYEFFHGFNAAGEPRWTDTIEQRSAVFENAGRCYRCGLTFHAGLNRYLLCAVLPHSKHPQGPRFQGGFGIYDAREPWGPWTTAYFTEDWDVGPGETGSVPTKWMSDDGRTIYLVSSSNDSFSVRKATLVFDE